VLAVFEGARADPALAELAAQLTAQRRTTAQWLVDTLARTAPVEEDAVDTLWVLMDPAVFDRLVGRLGWSAHRYRDWFARSAQRLLLHPDPTLEAPP
jgi:hypothetical protein